MAKIIISSLLLIVSAFLSLKHGWDAFQTPTAEQAKIMADLGINETIMPFFGVLSISLGILLLIPQTFFLSNVLNGIIILLIIAFSLRAGNTKMALIEIPFLILPLLLIWLKYPFKN